MEQARISPDDLQWLKQQVNGSVTTQLDKDYDNQRTPWLDVIDQLPAAIVNAATLQDIQTAVRFARERNLPLGVQNTGHGIARPCNGGILLRLSTMKTIAVDVPTRTATIEPGVQSGELLAVLKGADLAFPAGQASNVGVIGYTLGGGIGWLARTFGPACQTIKAATLVLADGSIVTTTATQDSDLFWALRGGGGNFGIVASLTVSLFPLGEIFGGLAYYHLKDAPAVMRFYRDWSAGLTNDTSTVLRLMQLPPMPTNWLNLWQLRGSQTCAIGICHTDPATADALHQQLLAFKTPEIDELKMRPYAEMGQFDQASSLQGSATFGQLECLRTLSESVLEGLYEVVHELMPPLGLLELQQLGGVLNPVDESMAYTAPAAPFALHLVSPTISTPLEELARLTQKGYDSLGSVNTGEVSYNFLRGDQQPRVPDAFSALKYARLQAIKQRYDPTNFFTLNLNIPPSEPADKQPNQVVVMNKTMHVLVIGAAGKTGRAVVEQAKAAGHQVTAFVRNAEKYDVADVRIIEGDATDPATMEAAVVGQDAVIDTIGGKTPYKTTTLESSAASAIIAAMQRQGVRRLVATSMLGEGESEENTPLYIRLLVSTFLRGAKKDKAALESAVKSSDLDWVILRPAILNDDPATGHVHVFDAQVDEKAQSITRTDLARFMVAQLDSDTYLHQAVTIANR